MLSKKRFYKITVFTILTVITSLLCQNCAPPHIPSPPGKIIVQSSSKLHIFGKGQNGPAVIFLSGLVTWSPYVDFYPVYSIAMKTHRVIVYERPGHGWSKPASERRNIDTMVSELQYALVSTHEKPPYILVAHSSASLDAIRYAQRFPENVSGIVFIDAGNPEYYASHKPPIVMSQIFRFLRVTGLFYLLDKPIHIHDKFSKFRNDLKLLPDSLKELDRRMLFTSYCNKSIIGEKRNACSNAKIVLNGPKLDSIKLCILTSESESSDIEWIKSQEAMKKWSKKSKQYVVKGSTHFIHHYNPELIASEIDSMSN
jgi:pimeloyl-ACP methyl ester carboxylesterase